MKPEERNLLELFCCRADSIASSPLFIENRISTGVNLKWERDGPLTIRQQGPSNQELLPLITIIRQTYSPRECIHIKKIHDLVFQHLSSSGKCGSDVLDAVRSVMAGFKGIMKDLPIGIKLGSKALSVRDIIDIWFNGNIFHAEPSKVATYNKLWNSPAGPMAEFCFRSSVVNLANLMVYFGGLIRAEILNKDTVV